jgi:S1-C subfamily serine protease
MSVVTVSGDAYSVVDTLYGPQNASGSVLGTGWVVLYGNANYIITNFHVVDGMVNDTVTFPDGNAYAAKVVGTDPYSDLAVVSAISAPPTEFHPLQIGSSAALRVGETVMAIGSPYGLAGTITVGVVSQLGRSLDEGTLNGYTIADTVQFSAPINPGNSGGPLLDSNGLVIGITTATATDQQGGAGQALGFAIPSDTIARELPSLIQTGTYTKHPYVGLSVNDMSYQIAQAMGTSTTYGVLVEDIAPNGPADRAGLKPSTQSVIIDGQQMNIGGDIIVSLDGTKIINYDAFSTYLETHTTPGQTVNVGIIRGNKLITVSLQLDARPPIQLDAFRGTQPTTGNLI